MSIPPSDSGSLLLINGLIYTNPPWKNPVNAIAIKEGKVVALGSDAENLHSEYRPGQTIDLKQRVVFPGFIDSHIHLTSLGESLTQLKFDENSSHNQIQQKVQKEVEKKQPGDWIIGGKWSRHILGGFPDKNFLDRVSPENPVALHSKDLHSLVLNSKALKILGITADTPDPDGGKILKDASGEPTGLLQENAMELFEQGRPPVDFNTFQHYQNVAAKHCHQYGITSVHSIDTFGNWQYYERLKRNSRLQLRIGCLIYNDSLDDVIENKLQSGSGDDWLWTVGIKIFTDGALGSASAWMKSPYENSDDRGIPLIEKGELTTLIRKCHSHNLSVGIHAIGDAAVQMTLQALNTNQAENPTPQLHDRIEHFQVVDPDDLQLVPDGFIAAVQPIHLFGDRQPADRLWGNRSRYAYAFQSLKKHQAILSFGSDAPVESVNPWEAIQAAVERRKTAAERSWYPEERISLENALTAYTVNNGRVGYRENKLGTLEVGALGDAVVLNQNPWQIASTDLKSIHPVMTILDGNVVFADGA